MGKNKGVGKKPSVFKVAGVKSLKAKSKAKPVTGNLKKINEIVRKNIDKIDQDLVQLQNRVREKKKENVNFNSNQKKKINETKEIAELEKEKQKVLERLNCMQF